MEREANSSSQSAFRIGRYQVIGRLGRGGMADVLLTLQDEASGFRRLVVVKRLLPWMQEDTEAVAMFLDEARLAARLSHTNVVQTFEVATDEDGLPFLAMEFLNGQSLLSVQRRAHSRSKRLPIEVILRIFLDVLEGMQYAHELRDLNGEPLGVVHRDVTPSNMFVSYDGVTKLGDFGIAKSGVQLQKTHAGILKGKMAYMSPEQLVGEKVTRTADLWALGVSLWETLAGARLFQGKNDFERAELVMRMPIPQCSIHRPDLPRAIEQVVESALVRDPTRRVQSAQTLVDALEEAAQANGISARKGRVATFMQELFGETIESNGRQIKAFLEQSAPRGVLNFEAKRTEGILLSDAPELDPNSSETYEATATGDLLFDFRAPETETRPSWVTETQQVDSSKIARDEKPEPAPREALAENPVPIARRAERTDDRPAWHWVALTTGLVFLFFLVYFALGK